MSSYRTYKLNNERPGSSAKVYDYGISDYESNEGSRIPKCPKRTYSLEGKRSAASNMKTFTKKKISTTSMIPRLKRNRQSKKPSQLDVSNKLNEHPNEKPIVELPSDSEKPSKTSEETIVTGKNPCIPIKSVPSLEGKISKEFANFKNNVLRIPEYWTDAGQTATNILKNAINIVTKQYPTVEKESFEAEIQSILQATESVKEQILAKTENIIKKATQIYSEKDETGSEAREEDLRKITKKMQELRNEVNARKNVFGDLLKCGNEMKKLMELEKSMKQGGLKKEMGEDQKKGEGEGRKSERRKSRSASTSRISKREKTTLQSCGDVVMDESKSEGTTPAPSLKIESHGTTEEKSTQTINAWTAELHKREKNLDELNNQILELQTLCKDHVSKFKSFNLQIKLKGICTKAQHMSVSKELEALAEEKMELEEKHSQLLTLNKDLEVAVKQKEMDLHQKDKLICQQKKLLHVRDELIEMLKSRCNLEEIQRY